MKDAWRARSILRSSYYSAKQVRMIKHKTENVVEKVLKSDWDKVKDGLRRIFYALSYEHAKEGGRSFSEAMGEEVSLSG